MTAVLAGQGRSQVSLVYVVSRARWRLLHDMQLRPESGRVALAFSGLVSQECGEDWEDALLTLSTAVPATTMALPSLDTWKLGEQEPFIPTARPAPVALRPPPPSPVDAPRRDEALRAELRRRVEAAPERSAKEPAKEEAA